jgi:hypothetical protein
MLGGASYLYTTSTSPQGVSMAKISREGSMGPATVGGLEPRAPRPWIRPGMSTYSNVTNNNVRVL